MLPIRARAAIYDGNLEEVIEELERVRSESTDPMLGAVLAEAYLFDGQLDQAAAMAERVIASQSAPDWLIEHAEDLLNQIQNS